MANTFVIFRREFRSYFATPIAYVFIVIFLFVTGLFTFTEELGNFLGRGEASLSSFFTFHPWLYLFLIPAISMRLWSEERKSGSIELLMTLPVTMGQAVLGKYLAAWVFTGVALALTFPLWITVNMLGTPDNGVIVAGYIGSFLMAGGFLAIGSCVSAMTRNQVIAFVVTVVVCLGFNLADYPAVQGFLPGWMPQRLVETVSSLGFLNHFNDIARGVLNLRDLIFFASLIALALFANAIVIERKKAQ